MSLQLFLILESLISGYFTLQSILKDNIIGVMAVPFIEAFAEVLYIPVLLTHYKSNIVLLWTVILFVLLPVIPAIAYSSYKHVKEKYALKNEQIQKSGGGMHELQGRPEWKPCVGKRNGDSEREEAAN